MTEPRYALEIQQLREENERLKTQNSQLSKQVQKNYQQSNDRSSQRLSDLSNQILDDISNDQIYFESKFKELNYEPPNCIIKGSEYTLSEILSMSNHDLLSANKQFQKTILPFIKTEFGNIFELISDLTEEIRGLRETKRNLANVISDHQVENNEFDKRIDEMKLELEESIETSNIEIEYWKKKHAEATSELSKETARLTMKVKELTRKLELCEKESEAKYAISTEKIQNLTAKISELEKIIIGQNSLVEETQKEMQVLKILNVSNNDILLRKWIITSKNDESKITMYIFKNAENRNLSIAFRSNKGLQWIDFDDVLDFRNDKKTENEFKMLFTDGKELSFVVQSESERNEIVGSMRTFLRINSEYYEYKKSEQFLKDLDDMFN
eukprot:TRINITY_DN1881_c0_g2_i1.p1 TRINITY_DN1881_c0_g2~~TRINITY_DN1881_c0_g2_i1.p1  ORF type:complete len:384 (-),score=119.77 TRINITY_DN1881_c0_g2_i1:102-1253(-)